MALEGTMIKYQENLAARLNGNNLQPLAGASVTVTDKATGLPAALYQDDELTPIPQPLVTTNTGYFGFKAANGEYLLSFAPGPNSSRFDSFTRDCELYDADDVPNPVSVVMSSLGAEDGAGKVGHGDGSVGDALDDLNGKAARPLTVAAGPRDALQYASSISVRVFRNFATMGGFRFRGQYTKGYVPTFPMPENKTASLGAHLGAGMTSATFENWYAVFACANDGDAVATIKIMPFLRINTVTDDPVYGYVCTLNKAGELVSGQVSSPGYNWANNALTDSDCLVISENGGYSGRVARILNNSTTHVSLDVGGAISPLDWLLPAPPGFDHYVYLGSFYFDTAEVRNIYDTGTLVKAKMVTLPTASQGVGAHPAPGITMDAAGYICPLASAIVMDSTCYLAAGEAGQEFAEYYDPDGGNHDVDSRYLTTETTLPQACVFSNIQVPFLYFQKFNYKNAGSRAAGRTGGQLATTGWIEL